MYYMDDPAERGGHLSAEGGHQSCVCRAKDTVPYKMKKTWGRVSGVGVEAQSRAKEKGATWTAHR
jgi:hypothetical protein